MNKKQKKMLIRILVAFVLFAVLFVCEHIGILEQSRVVHFVRQDVIRIWQRHRELM